MPHILIFDDHDLFAFGISEIIKSKLTDYQVTIANNIDQAIEKLTVMSFDMIFCDLNIDGSDGFEFLKKQKDLLANTRIVILSAYYEETLIKKAKKMGLSGYLKKDSSIEELIEGILNTQLLEFYTNDNSKNIKTSRINTPNQKDFLSQHRITPKEMVIIQLIAKGYSSRQISENLHISKNTVDTHRRKILRKLDFENSQQIVRFAIENKLV